jgi:hypothetical protein
MAARFLSFITDDWNRDWRPSPPLVAFPYARYGNSFWFGKLLFTKFTREVWARMFSVLMVYKLSRPTNEILQGTHRWSSVRSVNLTPCGIEKGGARSLSRRISAVSDGPSNN